MDPWKLGRYDEAIEAYTRQLRRRKSPQNFNVRAIAYLSLGRYDEAIADFQAADNVAVYTCDYPGQAIGVTRIGWLGESRWQPPPGWTLFWLLSTARISTRTRREVRQLMEDLPIDERELCQAEFYVGVRALQDADKVRAMKAFKTAAEVGSATFDNEYYLAAHEFKRRLAKIRRKPA